MTYDAARRVVVMLVEAEFGAPDAGVMQTWIWDGSTWSHAADVPTATPGTGGPVPISFRGLGDVAQRVAGADRFATAVAIAGAMGDPSTVFEASGTNFPDALSAVPAAIGTHGAIMLTNGSAQSNATSAYLNAHAAIRYAVGEPAAWADPSAVALAGATRYAAAEAMALAFFPGATGISAASGATFPDALAAGVLAGTANQPMLLVPPSGPLPEPAVAYLSTRHGMVTTATVYGGTAAISMRPRPQSATPSNERARRLRAFARRSGRAGP